MSNKKEPSPSSPNSALIVMAAGGLAVAGLVGWALTRSVEPPPVTQPSTDTVATASAANASSYSIPVSGEQQEPDKAAVPRISVEDLHAQYDRGAVTVIDVRDDKAYAGGHIAGAMHVPMASVQ